jgi:hypothetical protein
VRTVARTHGKQIVRVVGICAAVALTLAVTGGAVHLIRRTPAPQPVKTADPADPQGFEPTWTASIGSGPVTGVAASADTLYVSGRSGLFAYPVPCNATPGGTCPSEWEDPVPDGPLSGVALLNDLVFAGSAHGRVYAFPSHCDTTRCDPLWSGLAGTGPVPTPNANEDLVYAATRKLYAFPTHCGTGARQCRPAWAGDLPGRAAGHPADGSGLIVVSSTGKTGGIVAFPAVCTAHCHPVWSGLTGGPAGPPALSADSAFVVAHNTLLAFPMSCRGTCAPTWTTPLAPVRAADVDPVPPVTPMVAGDSVYIARPDGRLYVFPTTCPAATCLPSQTYDLGDNAPLLTPITSGGIVYVVSRTGTVTAIPIACDAAAVHGCETPSSHQLVGASSAAPYAVNGAVYVGDDTGTAHAFTAPKVPT